MSRLYDTVEPSVIDDDMLQAAVEEQGPREEAGKIAKAEGFDFIDVRSLRLDFKNVLKVENLWCFTNVTKLQLDNNIIEKIEGLELLVHLVWLDMSFNNIEVIEGLDKLTKLEDLTLYNNRISLIENMDTLEHLHVFSIGNNNLTQLDNVGYLRRFQKLQTLNLSGNPICEQEDYKMFVVAYLPTIDYLDYRLVDASLRTAALEKYDIAVQEMQHDEKLAAKKLEREQETSEQRKLHEAAHVLNMNGSHLFDSLYTDDPDGQKLNMIPGTEELIIVYKERFNAHCMEIFEYGLQKHTECEQEVDMFFNCLSEAKNENKQLAMKKIDEFMDYKNQLWTDMSNIVDPKIQEQSIVEYNDKANVLWDQLMGLEMQLVDQLDDVIKEFERNLAELVTIFIETVQGHLAQCRDLENQHHEKMLEVAAITLEKVIKNEMEEEIPEELRELFVDKDTMSSAVTTSHDVHLLKIDNCEDGLMTSVNRWYAALMASIHETEEEKRNRGRVLEINNLVDNLRDEIENVDWPTY